ncbi:AraC family transcriptional regulator [Siccirubricoccus sp. KC 17139]|uniref:AraC family transcriptional regulator n=1 Tax=Siccirubricoccus soli TaxID=2899147 RepID=A0ABT1D3U0_9PROT|nr:AraC family transcriptional regulator [Siccirubricoccus soli]MCO6416593.1 AraC family transcriptional regulator [Siccirubricoccus soli]MCP2682728.1 AraC family transcriptional regulator [Siccirubricoccus soli]
MSDTLSEVLHAVRLTGAVFYLVEASAPWIAVAPPPQDIAATGLLGAEHVMEFHLLIDGPCWTGALGEKLERLEPGEVVIFPRGDPHHVASDPQQQAPPPVPETEIPPRLPFYLRLGPEGAPSSRLVCGFLGCDARPFNPLLEALPCMLRVPAAGTVLAEFIRLGVEETAAARPGGEALRARLAETMFIEAVRAYLGRLPESAHGFLAGLRDPHLGRALGALHRRPAHPWTLEALAREAGLSRTPLQERFTAMVGMAPMQYLARWRMQVAASRLLRGEDKVAAIAVEVGYESEAAFNRAFKRLVGVPPAAWRRAREQRRLAGPR